MLNLAFVGPVDVSNCVAKWKYEVAAWQIFSKMEIFIHQLDQYGNLVPGFYAFDADVVEKETNLSIPVADLQFEEVAPGVQLFSYTIEESGNFLLTISDEKHNKSVSNMPYTYTVFVGLFNVIARSYYLHTGRLYFQILLIMSFNRLLQWIKQCCQWIWFK